MALINCFECGAQVSDKAEACPHCGVPLRIAQSARADAKDFTPAATETPVNAPPRSTRSHKLVSPEDHAALKNAVWGTIVGLSIAFAGTLIHEDLPGYGQLALIYSLAIAFAGIGALISLYRLATIVTTRPWLWVAMFFVPLLGIAVLIYLLSLGFRKLRTYVSTRKSLGY